MPTIRRPRKGSLQFWPRKRNKRSYARVRSWAKLKEVKLLGFAGYKVGMTHAMINDNRKTSLTKGTEIFCPVTIIECPPIKTASIRFYKNTQNGLKLVSEIFSEKVDKELGRKIIIPKKINKKIEDIKDFDEIRLLVYTQPKLAGIKKKPEIFEMGLGGKKEEQLKYAQEKLGKETDINDIFTAGQQVDIHAVTKGKGVQGAVKRFGIGLKNHKAEKGRRAPGSLGPWKGQGHIMWKVAHAGKMGYHLRTEYNKLLIKIGSKPEEINQKGGFLKYGIVKNPHILIKGSIFGPAKRLIRFNHATRKNKKIPTEAPVISYLSLESKQGN
ncbi:50S ribosomal protein L3 [Candidatus Woesearchaeota archaeon]|nr:50S ribosomal protein L3 [Candidatus Woesearchaeota archaeon]